MYRTANTRKNRHLNTCHACYALVDETGCIRYIGRTSMTLRLRWKAHKEQALKNDSQIPVHRWIREVGAENITIMPLFQDLDSARLDEAERFLISQCRRMGLPLLNVSSGGPGTSGVLQSRETRQKRSAALSGRTRPPRSPEWCARLSESRKGTKHSEATKRLISERTKAAIAARKAAALATAA